jgi:chromatin segregation and condensation protein Rec8/ScpA/Scc1 (kleisin family)
VALTEEENHDIDDLKRRLAILEIIREVSLDIRSIFGKAVLFARENRSKYITVFAPDPKITAENMLNSSLSVISSFPKPVELPKVTVRKVISLEEMLDRLAQRIKVALKMRFSDFSSYDSKKNIPREQRVEIIVGFLAMLEMVKQGILHVCQQEEYGDISMENLELSTPTYI